MVIIRLSRGGAHKAPFYHLVATDSRNCRDGAYKERLGYFNPVAKGTAERVRINQERLDYWVSVGAQLSPRVKSLVKEAKKAALAPKEAKPAKKAAAKKKEAKPADKAEAKPAEEKQESAE